MAKEKLKTTEAAALSDDALESVSGGYSIKHPATKEEYLESIGLTNHPISHSKGVVDDGF